MTTSQGYQQCCFFGFGEYFVAVYNHVYITLDFYECKDHSNVYQWELKYLEISVTIDSSPYCTIHMILNDIKRMVFSYTSECYPDYL